MPLSSSTSTASLSQSLQKRNTSTHSEREGQSDSKDWSIVFPGRARIDTTSSPFVSSPDEEQDNSNVELALPNEQDGTGRFTRPSSPFYAADDEEDEDGGETNLVSGMPASRGIGTSPTIGSVSEDDSELDGLELSSSVYLSGSERERRNSTLSHGQRRLSEWEMGMGRSSSSWAWMDAESSHRSVHRGRAKRTQGQSVLPVVFTSGSEGEGEEQESSTRRIREEEAAFEDALNNTPLAQSAGLSARVPKRRHRKNGESAKGSKRSNSSAVVTSDVHATRRRSGLGTRRSATSNYSARSMSRVTAAAAEKKKTEATGKQDDSRTHRLLNVILRKLFSVEDDEVLQAFLCDEGPLQVPQTSYSSLAPDRSSVLAVEGADDVWARNERNRQMRQASNLPEEPEEEEGEEEERSPPRELVRLPPRGMDSSQMLASPPRIRLGSHVGEPSLLEALQATMLSGLSVVPSGLSVLLAGSRSVRLAQYLAGRIGPSLTERVRKLIDDAEEDSGIHEDILNGEFGPSALRFRGGSHPAISSRSSTTLTSRADDSPSAAA